MNPSKENNCHDTVGILVLDSNMQVAAGVSSSGMAFKHPGRVGDSPLPGSGLYADDEVLWIHGIYHPILSSLLIQGSPNGLRQV